MISVFYSGSLDGTVELDVNESHHLVTVRRSRSNDEIRILNGSGQIAESRLIEAHPKRARLEITQKRKADPLRPELHLGIALPKGKTLDQVIQKSVELGVASIFPIQSQNSEVRLHPDQYEAKIEKWRQTAIAALKQSGNPWLPQLHSPMPLSEQIKKIPGQTRIIASLEAESEPFRKVVADHQTSQVCSLLIGPEGDFSMEEYAMARAAGFHPVTLGPTILKVETAVTTALGFLRLSMAQCCPGRSVGSLGAMLPQSKCDDAFRFRFDF